jgi:hypothetical protein
MLETRIVVGFSRLFLSEQEAETILEAVKKKGRYLVPAEIRSILGKTLQKTIADEEKEAMELAWIKFCRRKNLDQGSSMTNLMIFEAWWNWIAQNFSAPKPQESMWGDE